MRSAVRNLSETYESTPGCVAQARTQLADFAAQVGATPRQVEAVRLAASEAMTNAVLHAYRGGSGLIYVNAAVACGELWNSQVPDLPGAGFDDPELAVAREEEPGRWQR